MKSNHYSIITKILLSFLLISSSPCSAFNLDETLQETLTSLQSSTTETLQPLIDQYDSLPPKGRFGIGCIGGYTVTKLSVRTAVRAAKYTGAAFILSEVLNHAGVLDPISDKMSDEGAEIANIVRKKVKMVVNDCRMAVRNHVRLDKMREGYERCMERDQLGTLGFTTGAVAGLVW